MDAYYRKGVMRDFVVTDVWIPSIEAMVLDSMVDAVEWNRAGVVHQVNEKFCG
jgi:hypothetical protein